MQTHDIQTTISFKCACVYFQLKVGIFFCVVCKNLCGRLSNYLLHLYVYVIWLNFIYAKGLLKHILYRNKVKNCTWSESRFFQLFILRISLIRANTLFRLILSHHSLSSSYFLVFHHTLPLLYICSLQPNLRVPNNNKEIIRDRWARKEHTQKYTETDTHIFERETQKDHISRERGIHTDTKLKIIDGNLRDRTSRETRITIKYERERERSLARLSGVKARERERESRENESEDWEHREITQRERTCVERDR